MGPPPLLDPLPARSTEPAPLAQEPFVVALHELALDLLHRLQAHTDHDQHGGAAEREVLLLAADQVDEQVRQDRDDAQVERARQGDPAEDEVQVLRGRLARAGCPGTNPPYFFMLSATSVGLNVIAT